MATSVGSRSMLEAPNQQADVAGGVRGGQVYGSSDKVGAYPADRPVAPEDVAKTVYHALGSPTWGRPTARAGRSTCCPREGR